MPSHNFAGVKPSLFMGAGAERNRVSQIRIYYKNKSQQQKFYTEYHSYASPLLITPNITNISQILGMHRAHSIPQHCIP
jgi:hypothetical protein